MKQLCFVLMPFGTKTDGNKKEIDFDIVYRSFIREAILLAGLEPIRADEEKAGGFIHKPMYERLMFCDFAVADLSFANANVFYELGIRHALKPHTTVSIFETGTKIPFDTAPLRTFPYTYESGVIKDLDNNIKALAEMVKINLAGNEEKVDDSPVGQLVKGYVFPNLDHLEASAATFATAALHTKNVKITLRMAAERWNELENEKNEVGITAETKTALKNEQAALVNDVDTIVEKHKDELGYNYNLLYAVIDACKDVKLFDKVVKVLEPLAGIESMKDNIYIKQQLGLAYNKCGQRQKAKTILETIIKKYGADPETNGLLGAVYKGLMDDNIASDKIEAAAYHKKAVDTYLEGFEADPRDYYPGINALTLMYLGNKPDARFEKYMTLVKYAVERALRGKSNDYWVQATALELAALDKRAEDAISYCGDALICNPKTYMKETTSCNLIKIYEKAVYEGVKNIEWLQTIIMKLKPG